jgi:gamma-glutamyltranspeptidase/glutathione hydrolase
VAAVLGVVEPYSAGVGGGGFWLLQPAGQNPVVLDARETAPKNLTTQNFLTNGEFDRDKAINGALAAGIPGQPAAFALLAKEYGQLPLTTTLWPAIYHAQQGFPVDRAYKRLYAWRKDVLARYPSSKQLYHNGNPALGDIIKQPDLAVTLTRLAEQGHDGFYQGATATQLVQSVAAAGGVWTLSDLKDYRVIKREPIVGQYHDLKIISAPPPSAGGILLVNMLNMLEPIDFNNVSEPNRIHLLAEVMRRAYEDRSQYLGDPDFVDIPTDRLTSKPYAKERMENFKWTHATPSKIKAQHYEGTHTTHFSILDTKGNRVSVTLSINLPFGAGLVAAGTGVLLNNELDDFSLDMTGNNAYGLPASSPNSLAPGKRPLSSMSPTIIEGNDWIGILGTPGGSRITTMVLLGFLEAAAGRPVEEWVNRPRFHHQFLPDRIEFEKSYLTTVMEKSLRQKGHELKSLDRRYGNMQAIHWGITENRVTAASDSRGVGLAATGQLDARDIQQYLKAITSPTE